MAQTFEQIEVRVPRNPHYDVTNLAAWGLVITQAMVRESRRLKGAELREIVLVFERPVPK